MEPKNGTAQASGICHRLFSYVADGLRFRFRGVKRVTLSSPGTGGRNNPVATKPTKESRAYGNPTATKSLVEKASKLKSSVPLTKMGAPVPIQKNGANEYYRKQFSDIPSPSPRMIPLQGPGNEVALLHVNGQDEIQPKVHRGYEVAVPPRTVAQAVGGPKIYDGTKDRERKKKNGKNAPVKEKLGIEPKVDVKVRAPTPVRPVISNIDELSEELIRRTKEALRNSYKQT